MRILSLFDFSGYMLAPWTAAGHETIAVDTLHGDASAKQYAPQKVYFTEALNWDLAKESTFKKLVRLQPDIVFGFPPCTDLAVSGAKHFGSKSLHNPAFQTEAAHLARVVERLGQKVGCPWGLENPVGVLSTLWRKPDYYFHPWMYSGSLPEDDAHPDWPTYIPPRDTYTKNTCYWVGNGLWMPDKTSPDGLVVNDGQRFSNTFFKLGGNGMKTKIIRSLTPRGFAQAMFEVNQK